MIKRLLVRHQNKLVPEINQEIPENGIITVGTDPSSTITLDGESVASEQFVIVCEDGQTMLLCRVEGTQINGEVLPQGSLHNLQADDVISVGGYNFVIENAEAVKVLTKEMTFDNVKEKVSAIETQNSEEDEVPFEEIRETIIPQKNSAKKTQKNLKDILEGLRAEEKFYFQIENGAGVDHRVYVETEEMWLGWTKEGKCALTLETNEISAARAQIRKDWSGVVLYPLQTGNIWLNDEPLSEPHRLKNEDWLRLQAKEGAKPCLKTLVKFHEPTALLVLDSILPKELPPPVVLKEAGKPAQDKNQTEATEAEHQRSGQVSQVVSKITKKSLVFGYFTLSEVGVMIVGTLITAGLICLILILY